MKYFNSGKRGPHSFICFRCKKKSDRIGTVISTTNQLVCENCAIKAYQKEYEFSTLEIARAHRRRLFDVSYLLYEMLSDLYMAKNNLSDINDFTETDIDIIKSTASMLYNYVPRWKKTDLESMWFQEDIEKYLKKLINNSDLSFA